MRKNNAIIVAILLVVSLLLTWLWNYLGFSAFDPIDLTIAIVWWVIILGVVIAIIISEQRRRSRIRTIFVSDGVLYNCETGIVRVTEGTSAEECIKAMTRILDSLDYGSEDAMSREQARVRFNYIVRTKKFANGGRVWSGEVVSLNGAREPKSFSSVSDLSSILAA